MSDQLNIIDALSDPEANTIGKFQRPGDAAVTQRIAAVEAYPATGTTRKRVLDAIALSWNGLTDEQIQQQLHMNPSTQRPRRVELVEGGWIEDSGTVRRTSSGRVAVVWQLTVRASANYVNLPETSNGSVAESGQASNPGAQPVKGLVT